MNDPSPRKAHSGKMQQSKQQLEELLSCQICYCRAAQPTLCPHCSKLYCEACLATSLKVRAECPNCRRGIKGPLPQCGRFVGELAALLQAVLDSSEQAERCSEHGISQNYFCEDCRRSACCQCKMFGAHQQHRFTPIKLLYEHKYQQIRDLLSELKTRIVEQEHCLTQVENQLISIKAKTEAHIGEIEEHTDKYRQKLVNQHGKDERCEDMDELERESRELGEIKESLLTQLEHAKRINCYRIDQQLLDRLEGLLLNNRQRTENSKSTPVIEEAMPPLQLHTVTINDYSRRKSQNKSFVSEPVQYEGSKWRLIVYPRGSTSSNSLSIFLELMSNPDGLNLYLYHIELLHPQPILSLSKQHHARFSLNQCVGYGKFIKLEQLEAKQFIQPGTDMLIICFGVRFCSYYDLYCRRQSLLAQLSNDIEAKSERIDQLQSNLGKQSSGSIQLQ